MPRENLSMFAPKLHVKTAERIVYCQTAKHKYHDTCAIRYSFLFLYHAGDSQSHSNNMRRLKDIPSNFLCGWFRFAGPGDPVCLATGPFGHSHTSKLNRGMTDMCAHLRCLAGHHRRKHRCLRTNCWYTSSVPTNHKRHKHKCFRTIASKNTQKCCMNN